MLSLREMNGNVCKRDINFKKSSICFHIFLREVGSVFFIFFPLELNETVICTNDHMEVVIPSAFFLNKVPPVYVSQHRHISKVFALKVDIP